MGELSPWHWLIVAVVVLVLFGSKKLPDAARSLGRSLRIFKSEVSSLHTDDDAAPPAVTGGPQTAINAAPEAARPPAPVQRD
ncbi:MAG: twin-arginine translocase TatA/TatE family subunit [Actinoallomurus sp.]|jgi:sec-independent protein translocase protein TatA|nr:twin-arginine translocase TatA/TatE family subunit [Actinoallomurus sp.]